ncbi:MAG TPA: adenylate/guanylate cyclase domain-containing protein [bacterium]|nr:adenylate/guanylate cyclase domain-containing protein [bacterium]
MKAVLEVFREGEPTLRYEIGENHSAVLGRTDEADWAVPNEKFLSRRHAEVRLKAGQLHVKKLVNAANPLFHQGVEKEAFILASDDHFVIGKTRFVFTLSRPKHEEAAPELKLSMSQPEVYQQGGVSDRLRILDLLELPEILRLKSSQESFTHVAGLIRSVTGATWAQILTPSGKVLAVDSALDGSAFTTSRKLIEESVKIAPQPTLYRWSKGAAPGSDAGLQMTIQEGADWAVCAATHIPGEEPVLFYASGEGGADQTLKDNCRLVGLIADMVGRSLSVQRLEGLKERLQRFFSGQVVSKIIESSDNKDLEPRLSEGTVMFFDIRGFSKITEGKAEKILDKMDELREVMTAMTEEIFRENGVVLQFMGDGILACWNLPFPDKDHVSRACRAALAMVAKFERVAPQWRCGIGLHTGQVVAGSMGAKQLFSYTVMGPVVNQASRLEGITKVVEVPILVTREVAEGLSPETAAVRRIGRFQPAGMTVALDLFEIHPQPADDKNAKAFAAGLKAFEIGAWEDAYEILDHLPPSDRPARYLKTLAEMHRRRPPKEWKGIIELAEK